jgi:hypothetical protein
LKSRVAILVIPILAALFFSIPRFILIVRDIERNGATAILGTTLGIVAIGPIIWFVLRPGRRWLAQIAADVREEGSRPGRLAMLVFISREGISAITDWRDSFGAVISSSDVGDGRRGSWAVLIADSAGVRLDVRGSVRHRDHKWTASVPWSDIAEVRSLPSAVSRLMFVRKQRSSITMLVGRPTLFGWVSGDAGRAAAAMEGIRSALPA